jgi:hypothetical protein
MQRARVPHVEWAAVLSEVSRLLTVDMPSGCAIRADATEAVAWNSVATQRAAWAGPAPLGDPQRALERVVQAAPQLLALAADFVRRHGMTSWLPADRQAQPGIFLTERALFAWYELGGRPVLVLDEVPLARTTLPPSNGWSARG